MQNTHLDIPGPTSTKYDSYLSEQATSAAHFNNTISSLNMPEAILNDSRITPSGNGNLDSKPYTTQPTGGQKWWAAVILGFVFALLSSPPAYSITSKVTTKMANATTIDGNGPNLLGLWTHTILFIIIVRFILW